MRKLKDYYNSLRRETASGKYIPFVDGIRFLAIIPVVLMHANERMIKYNGLENLSGWEAQLDYVISRGAVGVMIFFTLSGFVLSLPFAKGLEKFSYKKYLVRRFTRLEPPYIFWMSCFALIFLIQSGQSFSFIGAHYLASLTYSHTLIYGEFSIINPVAWSLEVEIQYYLIAPFIALIYFNQKAISFRRAFLAVFLVLFVTWQHALGWQFQPYRATLLGQLPYFLIGLLIADIYKHAPNWQKHKHVIWDLIAAISFVLLLFTWTEEYGKTLVFCLAMFLLFIAALKGKFFPKMLSLTPLTIIGGMCYTIYLVHLPLLELLGSLTAGIGQSSGYVWQLSKFLMIALPMILLSTTVFYKVIEKPFMKKNGFQEFVRKLIPSKTMNQAKTIKT